MYRMVSIVIELIVYLIFVQPSGEYYTPEEKTAITHTVYRATAFWGYDNILIYENMIYPDQDVYSLPLSEWAVLPQSQPNTITIYVVDNSESRRYFFTGYLGYAQDYYRFAAVLSSSWLAATLAHELGHVLYGLPDWYLSECEGIDIMCDAIAAWQIGFIGCKSLAYIGKPCQKYYLPMTFQNG